MRAKALTAQAGQAFGLARHFFIDASSSTPA